MRRLHHVACLEPRSAWNRAYVRSFTKAVQHTDSALMALRLQLGQWLDDEGVAGQAAFNVKLVAHEAARNALAHGPATEDVVVTAELVGAEVVVEVVDTSPDPWALEVPASEDGLTGLQLINSLAQRVEAVPLRQGAALVMQLPVR